MLILILSSKLQLFECFVLFLMNAPMEVHFCKYLGTQAPGVYFYVYLGGEFRATMGHMW